MEHSSPTSFADYFYARRAAVGQLAARASSASAVLAASATPGGFSLALLGRRASQAAQDATRQAA